MQLGRIIPKVNYYPSNYRRECSSFSKLDTSKGAYWTTHDLYGDDRHEFYVILIDLFDRAMVHDNLHELSREQEKLLSHYFAQADTLTGKGAMNRGLLIMTLAQLAEFEDPVGSNLFPLLIGKKVIIVDDPTKTTISEADIDAMLANIWEIVDGHYVLHYSDQYQLLFDSMDKINQELDDFLGSYLGEDNGRYSRFNKEQLHSKRQPFSTKAGYTTRA